MIEGRFAGLLLLAFSIAGSAASGQTAKARKAVAPADQSKAHAWAEAVADFLTDRRLLESVAADDVEKRFGALVPPGTRGGTEGAGGRSFAGDPAKGVTRIEYELSEKASGVCQIGWVTIYMPRADSDGVDVLPRVIASLKRTLRKPWAGFHYPADGYYWDEREALLHITVHAEGGNPDKATRPNDRAWVEVHFADVEGFGEP